MKLVLIVFGELAKNGSEYLRSFEEELTSNYPQHSLEIWTIEKLIDSYIAAFGIYSGKGPDISLKATDISLRETENTPRSIICTISGEELGRIVNTHRYEVFQLNVREFFGKTSVNKEIEKTIQDPNDRRLFWYYNLGVTAICDRIEKIEKVSSEKTNHKRINQRELKKIELKNFRIINGCQTSMLIAQNYDKAKDLEVMMRIIETNDPSLAIKITIRNNTQNQIKGRDLFSQTELQENIQKYFEKRNPSIFYERRANEWRNLPSYIKIKFRDKNTRKYRRIKNDECAKAYMAFKLKKPAEAKMKKKLIFVFKENGGFYEDVFSENVDPEEYLLSYFVFNRISEKIKNFIKSYEELTEKEQKRLELERAFLPHANTQLTAMFGKVLDYKYPNGYNARSIYEFLESNPTIFDKIYEKL